MASLPYFAKGAPDVDAVAEFQAFMSAVGADAAHLLAELAYTHNYGSYDDIPEADIAASQVRDLCCRIVSGWAVFYRATSNPCRITILHAATTNPHPLHALESEAARRLSRLGP